MVRLLAAIVGFSSIFMIACNPTGPKSSQSSSSYLLKGTVSDGSGAISCAASSTVTDAGNGTFYVSFSCIETANPMRQISISTPGFVAGNPEGTTVTLDPVSVFTATYGNVQKAGSFTVWSTAAAGGSGTITFSKCPVGSNTVVATFNLTLCRPGQSDVTISNGTVGE